jgi:REP element-mobilizing transposase RayT
MPPIAYFITWTTYGSWLHGDDCGSVDDRHNQYGTSYAEPDRVRRSRVLGRQSEPTLTLEDADRETVAEAIRTTCEIRRWSTHALAVRTNHVHIVLKSPESSAERVAALVKSWATRAPRASGRHEGRTKFWTNQSSTRSLFFEEAVRGAVNCTMSH